MVKFIKIFSIFILIFILTVAFFRHSLCRFLIIKTVTETTVFSPSIENLYLDILNNNLYIKGAILHNPPEFENKLFGKVEEIFIKYDLWGSLLRSRLHFPTVKADIEEINIVRNERGKINVGKTSKKKKGVFQSSSVKLSKHSSQKHAKKPKKRNSKFLIDRLKISLKKVTFIDYKADIGEAAVIIFTSNSPLVFTNVSDLGYVFSSVAADGGFEHLLTRPSENIDNFSIDNKRIQ